MRSGDNVHCRECNFTGDLIQLLGADRSEPIEKTLDSLRDAGLVNCSESQRRNYFRDVAHHQRCMSFLKQQSDALRMSVPGSVRATLGELNCRVADPTVRQILPHICSLRAEELIESKIIADPMAASDALKWLGKYTAIGIPCWWGVELRGFWLITGKGYKYLTITGGRGPSTGFGLLASFTDESVIVVDNPVVALRLTLWSVTSTGKPTAFVCPATLQDNAEDYQAGSTVFWSPNGSLMHYARALNTPDARTLDHQVFPETEFERHYPARGNWANFQHQVMSALPAHQAMAYHLLDQKVNDVRSELANLDLDPTDVSRILSYTDGEDQAHLRRIFLNNTREQKVSWNGHVIVDTDEGWMSRGKIVSAARLYLEQIRPNHQGGGAVAGTVTYRSPDGEVHRLPFREDLKQLMYKTGDWLQRFIVARTGFVPYVERTWNQRLFEVAQRFHAPKPVLPGDVYGWMDGQLRMPSFTVDRKNVYASRSSIAGPSLPFPAPLSPGEWKAATCPGFCRIALALMANLVRTARERTAQGILLVDEPHSVSRLASALGSDVLVNPTTEQVDEAGLNPLPLFVDCSDERLADLFAGGSYRNVILSVDSHTARMARLSPQWLQLSVGKIEYPSLRLIFLLLPALLNTPLDLDSDALYRDIVSVIHKEMSLNCSRNRMLSAARELDTAQMHLSSNAATRVFEAIFYAIERQLLDPEYHEDRVRVNKHQLFQALHHPIVPRLPISTLTDRLADARFLLEDEEEYWVFDRMAWDLNASLSGASVEAE